MTRRKDHAPNFKDKRLAVAVARAVMAPYHASSGIIFPKSSGSMKNVEIIGQGIAYSVNLLYAVEILIKATLSAFGISIENEHDLWKLYSRLPKRLQEALESAYEQREGIGGHREFSFAIVSEASVGAEVVRPQKVEGMREVLKHSRQKYSQFRYAFEYRDEKNEIRCLHIQFDDLLRVADCFMLLMDMVLEAMESGKSFEKFVISSPEYD